MHQRPSTTCTSALNSQFASIHSKISCTERLSLHVYICACSRCRAPLVCRDDTHSCGRRITGSPHLGRRRRAHVDLGSARLVAAALGVWQRTCWTSKGSGCNRRKWWCWSGARFRWWIGRRSMASRASHCLCLAIARRDADARGNERRRRATAARQCCCDRIDLVLCHAHSDSDRRPSHVGNSDFGHPRLCSVALVVSAHRCQF